MTSKDKIRVAILASGGGSNMQVIVEDSLKEDTGYAVVLTVSNVPDAGVVSKSNRFNIPVALIDKQYQKYPEFYLKLFSAHQIDFIVLAGFLWLLPPIVTQKYTGRVINIHPSLLPLYGGKGMFGQKVHEAVLLNKEKKSGITIHFVNERYDEGNIIFQDFVEVNPTWNTEQLSSAVLKLEHTHYKTVIRQLTGSLAPYPYSEIKK
jgi:phosphoribosylglycinamide formyltransferase-1